MRSREVWMIALLMGIAGAASAESCHINSIDQAGHCKRRGFARRIVARELEGTEERRASPPVNANLLATQLLGRLASGELYPVAGSANEWVLAASEGAAALSGARYVLEQRYDSVVDGDQALLMALLRWQPGSDEQIGTMQVLATIPSITQLTDGSTAGAPPCIAPSLLDDEDEDAEAGGGQAESAAPPADVASVREFPDLAGEFRWMALGKEHRVLVAGVSRSEGYAGGGGAFNGEVLLEPRGDALVPVACVASNAYMMLAGDWNDDGTRQHHEYQQAWILHPIAGQGGWPRLQMRPETQDTAARWLRWDADKGYYIQDKVPSAKSGKSH